MFGKRRDGADFAPFNVASGGLGARATKDGVSCLAFPYNVGNTPAEIVESEVPIMVEERSLWQDSAGPGKFRGGFGRWATYSRASAAGASCTRPRACWEEARRPTGT
jgi:N-methylhydantoinase B